MKTIKGRYRDLMARWHPDGCGDRKDLCKKMAQKINRAYEIVISYCESYEYPFGEEELKRDECEGAYERWWQERFGDDPLWGGTKKRGTKRDR
jgi:DnaJ-class molecular chaperone